MIIMEEIKTTSKICSLIIQFACSVKNSFALAKVGLRERYVMKFIILHGDADSNDEDAK